MTKHEWNGVCDIEINKILKEQGFVLPQSIVSECERLTAEEIYNKLKEGA